MNRYKVTYRVFAITIGILLMFISVYNFVPDLSKKEYQGLNTSETEMLDQKGVMGDILRFIKNMIGQVEMTPATNSSESEPELVTEMFENQVIQTTDISDEFYARLEKIEKEKSACTSKYFLYGDITNSKNNTYNWIKYKITYLNNGVAVYEKYEEKTIAAKFKHGNVIYLKEDLTVEDSWSMSVEFPVNNCDPVKPVITDESFIRIEILEAGYDEKIYYR